MTVGIDDLPWYRFIMRLKLHKFLSAVVGIVSFFHWLCAFLHFVFIYRTHLARQFTVRSLTNINPTVNKIYGKSNTDIIICIVWFTVVFLFHVFFPSCDRTAVILFECEWWRKKNEELASPQLKNYLGHKMCPNNYRFERHWPWFRLAFGSLSKIGNKWKLQQDIWLRNTYILF